MVAGRHGSRDQPMSRQPVRLDWPGQATWCELVSASTANTPRKTNLAAEDGGPSRERSARGSVLRHDRKPPNPTKAGLHRPIVGSEKLVPERLVVEAVMGEPVSAWDFPDNRENTAICARFGLKRWSPVSN